MLPPVAAVSSASPVAPQREVMAVTNTLASLAAAPDSAVALSLAVSTGVEGKLNMLLINARDRMLDSLFAVIDAVSQSLALQQEAGENNAGYALRLADAMTDLPPKQVAALQQQLAAQGQTAPLSLVAAALHDPTSAQAAQLVAYLEVVRYKDKDLATKSVVASYEQNDGSMAPEQTATSSEAPPRNAPAPSSAVANPAALPQTGQPGSDTPMPAAGPAAAAGLPTPTSQAADALPPGPALTTVPETAAEPSPQAHPPLASVEAPLLAASANPVATELLQAVAAEAAATVVTDLALEAKPTLEETTPRAILQIRSDIQDGLKAVFDRLIQATGTELLQTMAEAGPLADKIVAQALIADMIDETQLNGLPMPDNGDATDKTPPIATALPVSPSTEAVADAVPALLLAMVEPAEDIPEPAQTVILPQPSATPPGLAVGFITTPYAPAEDVAKSEDPLRIDRVDAVDDDEHEEPGSQQQQAGQHDEPETPAEAALDMLSAEPDTAFALTEEPPPSRSSLIALPHHTPDEPLPNPGYDLYERMGA